MIRIIGKGGKVRVVPMSALLKETLEAYVATLPANAKLLFPSRRGGGQLKDIRWAIRRAKDRLKITRRVTPHMMRHTFSTAMVDAGLDLRSLADLLGHESVSTTQIYTHPALKTKQAAIERTFG